MTIAKQTAASAPRDLDALLAELEHTGRRHAENLDGLRKIAAHYRSEAARLDAEIVVLTESALMVAARS